MVKLKKPRAIVFNLEGTMTPSTFVSKTLFPYIRTNLKKYLEENWESPALQVTIARLREESSDGGNQLPRIVGEDQEKNLVLRSVMTNVLVQMEVTAKKAAGKKKSLGLKQIQVLLWIQGYQKDEFKAKVFDDVPTALHRWKRELNIKLYAYSSGLIVAQQLIFSNSVFGNLLPLIDDFFEKDSGSKSKAETYKQLADKIEESPEKILFITDNDKEMRTALKAGLKGVLIAREGQVVTPQDSAGSEVITTLEEIEF